MRRYLALLAGVAIGLAAMTFLMTPVTTQTIARVFGTYNNNPIALLGNATGALTVEVAGGAVPATAGGTGQTTVTKGDTLIGAAAGNAWSKLAVGTDTYVLTADSTATDGVAWKVAAGGILTDDVHLLNNCSATPMVWTGTNGFTAPGTSSYGAGGGLPCAPRVTYTDAGNAAAEAQFVIPTNWNSATAVSVPAFYFSSNLADNTKTAYIGIAVSCTDDGEATQAYAANVEKTLANQDTANKMNISAAWTALTMTGCSAGDFARIRVARYPADASDTIGTDWYFYGLVLRFTLSSS